MGTNYYWADKLAEDPSNKDDINVHIGKRSAAGTYCWDCGTTLCLDGARYVHYGEISLKVTFTTDLGSVAAQASFVDLCGLRQHRYDYRPRWSDTCPCCGKSLEGGETFENTGGVELGFTESSILPKEGVTTAASFTWTLLKHRKRLDRISFSASAPVQCVVDEYGRAYTAREFLNEALRMVPRSLESQLPCEFS